MTPQQLIYGKGQSERIDAYRRASNRRIDRLRFWIIVVSACALVCAIAGVALYTREIALGRRVAWNAMYLTACVVMAGFNVARILNTPKRKS